MGRRKQGQEVVDQAEKSDSESGCDLDVAIDGDVDDLKLSSKIYDHATDEQLRRPVQERLREGYEMIGWVNEEMPRE